VHLLLSQNGTPSQWSGWMENEKGKWAWRLKSQNKYGIENAEFGIQQELFHSCFLLQLVVG